MYFASLFILLLAGNAVGETDVSPTPTSSSLITAAFAVPYEIITTATSHSGATDQERSKIENLLHLRANECVLDKTTLHCPLSAPCTRLKGCYCPGCCPKGAVCMGCPQSTVIMDAKLKVRTSCITEATVLAVPPEARAPQVRAPSDPQRSSTVELSSLAESIPTQPGTYTYPAPTTSASSGQAAPPRGVMQPFAWAGRLMSSLCLRVAHALPVRRNAITEAAKTFDNTASPSSTNSHGASEANQSDQDHHRRAIGDHKHNHQHLHQRLAVRSVNSTVSTMPVTVTSTVTNLVTSTITSSTPSEHWTTMTSTSTVTVYQTQGAAQNTTTSCGLRRKRGEQDL